MFRRVLLFAWFAVTRQAAWGRSGASPAARTDGSHTMTRNRRSQHPALVGEGKRELRRQPHRRPRAAAHRGRDRPGHVPGGWLEQRTSTAEDGSGLSAVEVVAEELGHSLRWATATTTKLRQVNQDHFVSIYRMTSTAV